MDNTNLKTHQEIGQDLELFFTDEIAPGAPFWLPKGMVIFKELEKYIREITNAAGYLETSTPIMVKSELFRQSGHFTKFGEHNMYNLVLSDEQNNEHAIQYTLKPMNCPESTILYRFKIRSYKDLPLRFSEIGRLHRKEKSGEINGLFRVRQMTMDDAHIFATEDQIFDEVSRILDMMVEFYKKFGFEYEFRFATRPDERAGKDENWDKAEKDLAEVLEKKGIKASDKKGDGAFYGPKIDMHIKDSLGREWQLATVQLDFHQPEAFGLEYIDSEGKPQRPVIIHRAIFGSFERFIGILTEHYQGAFPLWLAPVQVAVLPITDNQKEYAQSIVDKLREEGIRTEIDDRSETLQSKIRDATLQKVPFMGIIGKKEAENGNLISVRDRQGQSKSIEIQEFLTDLKNKIEQKL